MTDWRFNPRALDPTGLPDGDYTVQISGGQVTWGTPTPVITVEYVVISVTNGVPMLMFDADSTPVTTEVPS